MYESMCIYKTLLGLFGDAGCGVAGMWKISDAIG